VGFQRVSFLSFLERDTGVFPWKQKLNDHSRRPVLIWLIISQALAVASLFFWLLRAGLSVMAFDSGVTVEAWTIVIAV
jgi:hypothetical protein